MLNFFKRKKDNSLLITPMILTNSDNFNMDIVKDSQAVTSGESVVVSFK